MTWTPTYQAGWATFQTFNPGPVVVNSEAIRIMPGMYMSKIDSGKLGEKSF